jgi:6-phosphogluconolactonase/glucosamine-6-phosphate isomerase/deaminase
MPHHRMTLGPIVLRAAKKVVVMISGQEKRETLAALMNELPDPTRYFVQLLWPILDRVTWFIDRAAAFRFHRDADEIA